MLSLVSASVEALFFFSRYHTFVGGSSRVAEAMSSERADRDDRSRSPARVASNEATPTEVKEGEFGEQGTRCEEPDEGIEDPKQEVGKEPETPNPTPAEESTGRVLLNTIIDASKNLQDLTLAQIALHSNRWYLE